jgi:hypothetical protein
MGGGNGVRTFFFLSWFKIHPHFLDTLGPAEHDDSEIEEPEMDEHDSDDQPPVTTFCCLASL